MNLKHARDALEKINHTICLNADVIKFNVDKDEHIDCLSLEEFGECYDTIEDAFDTLEKDIEIQKEDYEILDECTQSYKEHLNSLEIIFILLRKKGVEVGFLRECKTHKEYNEGRDIPWSKKLSKTEFDLLRRHFK